MKINIFLRLLYRFLQFFVWFTYAIYFRRIAFINRPPLRTRGPMLVLTNHPNTLMDPLMILHALRERCFILANYSLFKKPISRAIFSTLYCLPVQRAKDVEGLAVKNDDTFRQCDLHLAAKGSIYIAPEGISAPERHIRPFKTGTARIAFSAESHNDFSLDLKILLVGLTYEKPLKFRHGVVAHVAEPILVKNWADLYAQNPREAVQDLTKTLEEKMKELVVHCRDAAEDRFLKQVDILLQHEKPLNTEGVFWRSKKTLAALNHLEQTQSKVFFELKNNIENYFNRLKSLKINDLNPEKNYLSSVLIFLLGLPIFLLGVVTNGLPALICDRLSRWLKLDESYETTTRYASGLLLFPIFWAAQIKILYAWLEMPFAWWVVFLSFLPSGFIAWHLGTEGGRFLNFLKYKKHDKSENLTEIRQEIMRKLQEIIG